MLVLTEWGPSSLSNFHDTPSSRICLQSMERAAVSLGTRRRMDWSNKGKCLANRMVKGVSGFEGSLRRKGMPDLNDGRRSPGEIVYKERLKL